MPTEAALRQWNEDYEMSAAQEKLTRELFKRKQMEPAKKTPITEAEWKTVLQEGKDGGGSEESRQSLTEAGFIVP
jgi:hypothetical protein